MTGWVKIRLRQAKGEKNRKWERVSVGIQASFFSYTDRDNEAEDKAILNVLTNLSNILIPVVVFYIVAYGLINGRKVYEDFIKGAKDGVQTVVQIMPTLIGLMVAVGVLRASGFLQMTGRLFGSLTDKIGFPSELVPVVLVKMFSSSAATGLVLDIFKTYGPDSYIGMITSIMMSCTETIFYTMSVYFLAAKVTKTRYTLTGALLATLAGVAVSVVMAGYVIRR